MSRWGRPIKNKKRSDPRYFLNEQEEAESAAPLDEKEVFHSQEQSNTIL